MSAGSDLRPEQLAAAFEHLVLDGQTLTQLGTAFVSGRHCFSSDLRVPARPPSAENLSRLFQSDTIRAPYAVEIDGQIVTVFDPNVHVPVEHGAQEPSGDERWVLCRRPSVIVGGELTIEMMDPQINPVTKYYAAPLQMKANNGLLIIDDFGRQRVRPEELLEPLAVPLDRSLTSSPSWARKKVEVPFDVIDVFATNLDPAAFVDEAFCGESRLKIRLGDVSAAQFHEIPVECRQSGVTYDSGMIDHLITLITQELHQPPSCLSSARHHRSDLLGCPLRATGPELTETTVANACRNYFLHSRSPP